MDSNIANMVMVGYVLVCLIIGVSALIALSVVAFCVTILKKVRLRGAVATGIAVAAVPGKSGKAKAVAGIVVANAVTAAGSLLGKFGKRKGVAA